MGHVASDLRPQRPSTVLLHHIEHMSLSCGGAARDGRAGQSGSVMFSAARLPTVEGDKTRTVVKGIDGLK